MTNPMPAWKIISWIVGIWWLAHLVLIAGHVLHVFLYSVAVAPGLEYADYQAYAQVSAPWFSIILGGPVFYTIGRIVMKRLHPNGRRMGLIIWGLYTVTDLAIVIASVSPIPLLLAFQWIVSQSVKLIAIMLATRKEAPQASVA